MPSFGKTSKERLATVHPHLRLVVEEVIKHVDFKIIHGWRGEDVQNQLFEDGASKTPWPKSKHNNIATAEDVAAGLAPNEGAPLSLAIDFAPWYKEEPHIRWKNIEEFYMYAGIFRGVGMLILPEGWLVRLGADWDLDGSVRDQTFHDVGHLELQFMRQ